MSFDNVSDAIMQLILLSRVGHIGANYGALQYDQLQ